MDMFGGFEFAGDMGAIDFIASQMGVSKETIEELRRISSLSEEELNAELNPLVEKILVKGEGLTHQEALVLAGYGGRMEMERNEAREKAAMLAAVGLMAASMGKMAVEELKRRTAENGDENKAPEQPKNDAPGFPPFFFFHSPFFGLGGPDFGPFNN